MATKRQYSPGTDILSRLESLSHEPGSSQKNPTDFNSSNPVYNPVYLEIKGKSTRNELNHFALFIQPVPRFQIPLLNLRLPRRGNLYHTPSGLVRLTCYDKGLAQILYRDRSHSDWLFQISFQMNPDKAFILILIYPVPGIAKELAGCSGL